MKLRLLSAVFSALLFAEVACAHSPFDCSARVVVHADTAEVMLTVGTTLGEDLLRPANIAPSQLPAGHPFTLAPDFATNLFTTSAEGNILVAREADVITDGLELQFHFEYALAPAKSLGLETKFIPALKAPRNVPLVLTDENGNIFASTILSPGKTTMKFALPERLFPATVSVASGRLKVEGSEPATSNQQPAPLQPAPSFTEFLKLGISHILNVEAFDHLLFLTALLLGCRKLKTMLLVITCFTLAHSLTLALAALDVVSLSPRIVEPLIAASIIFVAADNFRRPARSRSAGGELKVENGGGTQLHPQFSIRQRRSPNSLRYTLTCGFGLIHGFGFASALRASGLAGTGAEIAMPLLAFNGGVEIGQLTVAAVLLPLLVLLERWSGFARNGARVISALVILVAAFWLWQRLMM